MIKDVMVFIPSTCSRVTSRLTSRITSRVWRGMIWHVRHLRADSVVWLSHKSSVWPWSGMPKVHLYNTFLGGLHQCFLSYQSCVFGWRHSLNHHGAHWLLQLGKHLVNGLFFREVNMEWLRYQRWLVSTPIQIVCPLGQKPVSWEAGAFACAWGVWRRYMPPTEANLKSQEAAIGGDGRRV